MMFDKIKQLGKESVIYGMSRVIGRFIGIFLVPIYTRIFAPSDYGVLDLIGTLSAIIGLFIVLGFDSAQAIYFYGTDEAKDKKLTLSTSFLFQLGASFIISLMLFFSSKYVSELIFGSPDYAIYIRLVAFDVPFLPLINFTQDLLLLTRKPWKYTFFITGSILCNITLTILMVVVWRKGIYGIYLSKLIIDALFAIIAIYLIKPWISFCFSIPRLKQLLAFGIPLIPASISYWVLSAANRYFMNYYISLDSVGLYSVGNKIASMLALVTGAFQLAWGPFAMSIHRDDDSRIVYSNTLTYYLVITSIVGSILSIFAPEALKILTTEAYYGASVVVPYLIYGLIGNGAYYIVSIGVNITKKTYHIGWTTIVAAGLNIVLNFLLIPRFGIIGAALASSVSFWISTVLLYLVSQRYYHIPYKLDKAAIILSSSILLIVLGNRINISNMFLAIPVKASLLIPYMFFIMIILRLKPSKLLQILHK